VLLSALERLDEIVPQALACLQIPGAAVAVINRDGVVFAKAYGSRDIESKLPVTLDTAYSHLGHGSLEVLQNDAGLVLRRGSFELQLEHWHYDTWLVAESDCFPAFRPQPLDSASPVGFETSAAGEVAGLLNRP
jgi:hypothetical protein